VGPFVLSLPLISFMALLGACQQAQDLRAVSTVARQTLALVSLGLRAADGLI
jgi:hypothetical protein